MSKPNQKNKDYEQIGRMVANIYESGYIDKGQMLKTSFLKGMVTGLGGVIGATIVVALLLWVLSLFDQAPLIGPVFDSPLADRDRNNAYARKYYGVAARY